MGQEPTPGGQGKEGKPIPADIQKDVDDMFARIEKKAVEDYEKENKPK